MERRILLRFYAAASEYDSRWTLSFCTKCISTLIWWLREYKAKGQLCCFLNSQGHIKYKIKYYILRRDYFLDRENESLESQSTVAPSGAVWAGRNLGLFLQRATDTGFTSGKWEVASTSASQQQGERKAEKWLQKWVGIGILAI